MAPRTPDQPPLDPFAIPGLPDQRLLVDDAACSRVVGSVFGRGLEETVSTALDDMRARNGNLAHVMSVVAPEHAIDPSIIVARRVGGALAHMAYALTETPNLPHVELPGIEAARQLTKENDKLVVFSAAFLGDPNLGEVIATARESTVQNRHHFLGQRVGYFEAMRAAGCVRLVLASQLRVDSGQL